MNIEEQADLFEQRISGWEENALRRIGARIKKTGKLSVADVQSLNYISDINGDINEIIKELSKIINKNISEVKKMYSDLLEEKHLENKPLYDYRNKPFTPLSKNKELQAIVNAYAKSTSETMLNFAKTKMLGFYDEATGFKGLRETYLSVMDKAVTEVASGATDFNTVMRTTIKTLGGSGLRVYYGGEGIITRRLDTVVRQNLMWGAKQAYTEYMNGISEELDCDGFEVDWHNNPRPTHEFMQGKQFANGEAKTVDGVYYPSGYEALERLEDYNCYHFKTPIILGVSVPTYDEKQLAELNKKNDVKYDIDGTKKTGYEWSQVMRKLETETRKQRCTIAIAEGSGDTELIKECKAKISEIEKTYNKISSVTGIAKQQNRMGIQRGQ